VIDQSAGIKIHQGDQVVAGQRIGRVGMTGRTTGPHLHWTLKYEGKFVDPAIVLRTMYTAQAGRVSSVPQ
jgi:murein DD-endopeptidase MepM/ murein hydrolase activator NlpD